MMRSWQAKGITLMAVVAAWLVWAHPPDSQKVYVAAESSDVQSANSVHLLFVGDVMLSRAVGEGMRAADDWTLPFTRIASVTAAADITFGNLESVISERGAVGGCGYCFRADPRVIAGLQFAGFDVLSLANNHAWDYGLDALTDTLQYAAVNDISIVGAGRTLEEAYAPIIWEEKGVRIAFLAFTDLLGSWAAAEESRPGIAIYDEEKAYAAIALAGNTADVIIVSFHSGEEYELQPTGQQENTYRGLIDAGADLVIGHHPHVVQPLERYNQGWIAYSLGNFIFDQLFSEETTRGLLLDVTVDDGSLLHVASRSIGINSGYQAFLE